jgi:hypothetical protein
MDGVAGVMRRGRMETAWTRADRRWVGKERHTSLPAQGHGEAGRMGWSMSETTSTVFFSPLGPTVAPATSAESCKAPTPTSAKYTDASSGTEAQTSLDGPSSG